MLVASVTNPSEIDRVKSLADLIELRLDHFEIAQKPPCPCIFTLRKKSQGGLCSLPELERLARIEKYLDLEPEYCDIETDTDPSFIAHIACKFPKTKLIGSYHNFEETPPLDSLKLSNPHFAITKIAVTAQSTLDMLRLLIFAQNSPTPISAISLGEFGKPSRVLGPIIGSALNYAGLDEDHTLHRYSLQTLHEVFHYRQLNRQTQIYALIGDPVEQSVGHLFHNPLFKHNAVYVKMRLTVPEIPEFFRLIQQLPFGGLSITMPLKECISSDPINTVVFHGKHPTYINTDGPGALNAIEKHTSVKGKHLAIIGAGGTARAIAAEAKKRGATFSVYNRTLERAQQFSDSFYPLDQLHPHDILINTIPVLIAPHPGTIVMDVIYHPRETPLLSLAKKLNCHCIYGEEMFIEQALLQQQAWNCL